MLRTQSTIHRKITTKRNGNRDVEERSASITKKDKVNYEKKVKKQRDIKKI